MRAPVGVGAGVRGGARGWNADQFGRRLVAGSQYCRMPLYGVSGVEGGRGGVGWSVGTLLGPEGTGRALFERGWLSLVRGCPDLVPPSGWWVDPVGLVCRVGGSGGVV